MNAKDRIRAWFTGHSLGEPYITGLNDYPEPQLQIELDARAAFWPRALFEQDWPAAERELERFFVSLARGGS